MARPERGAGPSVPGAWERFRLIADNSREVVLQTDAEGYITWIQPTVTALLGWEPDDLVGHRAREFVHDDDMARMLELRDGILLEGQEIEEVPIRYLTRDGGHRDCTVHGRPLHTSSGVLNGAVMVIRDASAQLSALRALSTMSQAGSVLVQSHDEQTLLDDTCRTLARTGNYAYAWYVRDVEGRLVPVASSGGFDGWLEDELAATSGSIPASSPSGRAIRTRRAVVVPDVLLESAYERWHEGLRSQRITSALALPVLIDDEVDGALVLFASDSGAFDDDARGLFEDLAGTLGYGIGRLRDAHAREALLAETENQRAGLQATIDSLFEPLTLLEARRDESGHVVDLVFTHTNDAALAYNESTREEMLGHSILDFYPNLDADGPFDLYLRCAETGERVVLDDYPYPNAIGGEVRRYDLRAARTPEGIALTWRDVTDRWLAEQQLRDDERRYRLIAEHGSDVLWEVDADGLFVWASAAVTRLLGWTVAELVGTPSFDLLHPDDLADAAQARRRVIAGESPAGSEYRVRCADGTYRWMYITGGVLDDAGGRMASLRDIHDEMLGRVALARAARHDPVTGAPTRAVLLARLQEELDRGTGLVALLCADVDGLSAVNESLSYALGDEVLAALADRMALVVGDWDRVGRGSGDELLVLLTDLSDGAAADQVADDLREAVRAPLDVDGHTVHMSVSIGIATSTPGVDAEQMLRDAAVAMGQAKDYGGDRAAYVDPELSEQASRRLHLEGEIRDGLQSGQFQAWLQPVVQLLDGSLAGYEALVRWVREDGTIVPPFEFLSLAERTGLVIDLDHAVLDRALASMRLLPEGTTVAVNVAASTLRRSDLPEVVLSALARHDVPAARLHLEVTETALLDDVSAVKRHMHEIADAGVKWYVDDFGTGYSSISHLRDLPIAGLKLDRSFTFGVAEGDRRCTELSQALVGLAEGLGLDGVAEGVETEAVARVLAAHGWKHGQGWLFGKPAPPPTG